MFPCTTSGVFLQRVDDADTVKILITLSRSNRDSSVCATTHLTLHIDKQDNSTTFDFDPWSDINVVPDGSIDEKDIEAIRKLAVAFYRQATIDPELLVFLTVLNNPADVLRVKVYLFERDEDEEKLVPYDYSYTATSVDNGINFQLDRVNPHSGSQPHEASNLAPLLRAFISMKL